MHSHSLRILVVSQYFWPENFRINELVSELNSDGHAVTVLTGKPNYPEGEIFSDFINNSKAYSKYNGSSVIRVPMLPRKKGSLKLILNYISFFVSASTIGIYKLRKEQFDVIFVFGTSPVTVALPALILKKIKKAPVIFWVLDLWPETLLALGVVKSKFILRQVGKLVSFIYNNCDLILGSSKGFEKSIGKYCDDPSKFRYFPNWSETVFEVSSNKQASQITRDDKYFNIIFAGNIGEAQDFSSILDAAEKLSYDQEIKWYIVGDGRVANWVQKEIKKRGLENSFFLLGRFPLKEMSSFYNAASALLVSLKANPIFSLTVPGKVQSYMSSGKPVLAMLDGEGANLIKETDCGLVCPSGDSTQLAENILIMKSMGDKELSMLGENGREYAKQAFSKKYLVAKLEKWLFESTNGKD